MVSVPVADVGGLLVTLVSIAFWVLLLVGLGVVFFIAYRFFRYRHTVEIFEKKGDELHFYGDDKADRVNKRGVSTVKFLYNKDFAFQQVKWPDNEYLYPKKFAGMITFGTKMKYLLINDELVPFRMKLGNPHAVVAESMPAFQKRDFIQRFKAIDEKYQADHTLAAKLAVAGIGIICVTIIIALFFFWQQNVSYAEQIGGLGERIADAAEKVAALQSNTVPSAPG